MSNTDTDIQSLYENNIGSAEIEVRYGNFNSKGSFTPGVSAEQFNNLMNYFSERQKYFTFTQKNQKILYFKNGKRTTINLDDNSTYSYVKRNIDTINVPELGFRMSVAKETPMNVDPSGEPQKITERTRYSYEVPGYFRFDIDKSKDNEYSIELESIGADFNTYFKNIFLIVSIIQDSRVITPKSEEKAVLNYYVKIAKSPRFAGVQPATINNKSFKKNEKYALTLKLDGVRNLCICYNSELYIVSSKLKVKKLGFKCEKFKDFVLDGELFRGDFHVFDAFGEGNLQQRMDFAKKVVASLQPKKKRSGEIYIKEYVYDNVYEEFLQMKKTINYKVYDGIIFTKTDTNYKNSAPLKWKPVERISIDFQIQGNALMAQGRTALEKFADLDTKYLNKFADGDIVECVYDKPNKIFVPIKPRPDKTKPNFIAVAKDNMSSIISPFDESLLNPNKSDPPLKSMRKFHNWVKRNLIHKYTPHHDNPKVLDLACGRGGDFGKYIDLGFTNIIGYDINQTNLDEATQRSSELLLLPENEDISITTHRADLSKEIVEIDGDKSDLVVCNFAFHFFSKSLDVFINNVALNCKPNTHLILTFIDKDLLKFKQTKDWSVKKIDEDHIKVQIKGSMLDETQEEPIVDIQEVISMFAENDIELVERTSFESFYPAWNTRSKSMSQSEKSLSFMNTSLVFLVK